MQYHERKRSIEEQVWLASMFASVRGLFVSDDSDTAPEPTVLPGASSTSFETQDTFAPLADEPSAQPDQRGLRAVGASVYHSARDGQDLSSSARPRFQNDEGTDTGVSKRRRPLAERADVAVIEDGKAIKILGDAVDHVTGAMQRQIERGETDGFKPNVPITGDAAARKTFYTLLPDTQQRQVFMQVAGSMRNWPRLRALFGAPPYSFLKSEDGNMLRAAGIAAGRSSMTYENSQYAVSYTQFGTGQLVDLEDREYRVVPSQLLRLTDPAPWLLDVAPEREIILQVRIKKRDRKRKIELLRTSDARKLTFPRPGETIYLTPTASMLSIQRSMSTNVELIALVVRRVIPRGDAAATAAVIAQLA